MTKFHFVDISQRRYSRDKEPNECPICHFAVQANEIEWTLTSTTGNHRIPDGLEIVYQCPRLECYSYFIARYLRSDIDVPNTGLAGISPGLREFVLHQLVPNTPKKPHIPEEVASTSPLFPEIYIQAIAAETYGLHQIAGGGYRKAVEFLIKDYCIFINKAAENEIKSSYLAPCINKFVDSPQIKICAERAAWLGNDEIHYERRWTDKDITNLKELIILTMNWIQSSVLTYKYAKDMPKEGK
jgi:hypothetical protein